MYRGVIILNGTKVDNTAEFGKNNTENILGSFYFGKLFSLINFVYY